MTKHKNSTHHYEDLKTHAKALVHATGDIADEKISDARSKLAGIIDSISDTVDEAEHMAIKKAKQADGFIKENPYKAAGIALGAGTVLGFLLSRRGK